MNLLYAEKFMNACYALVLFAYMIVVEVDAGWRMITKIVSGKMDACYR